MIINFILVSIFVFSHKTQNKNFDTVSCLLCEYLNSSLMYVCVCICVYGYRLITKYARFLAIF